MANYFHAKINDRVSLDPFFGKHFRDLTGVRTIQELLLWEQKFERYFRKGRIGQYFYKNSLHLK